MKTVFACLGMVLLLAAGPAGALASSQPSWNGMRKCGSFKGSDRSVFWVYSKGLSCRGAHRVQREYWIAKNSRQGFRCGRNTCERLRRMPAWHCRLLWGGSSGVGRSICSNGRIVTGTEIWVHRDWPS